MSQLAGCRQIRHVYTCTHSKRVFYHFEPCCYVRLNWERICNYVMPLGEQNEDSRCPDCQRPNPAQFATAPAGPLLPVDFAYMRSLPSANHIEENEKRLKLLKEAKKQRQEDDEEQRRKEIEKNNTGPVLVSGVHWRVGKARRHREIAKEHQDQGNKERGAYNLEMMGWSEDVRKERADQLLRLIRGEY